MLWASFACQKGSCGSVAHGTAVRSVGFAFPVVLFQAVCNLSKAIAAWTQILREFSGQLWIKSKWYFVTPWEWELWALGATKEALLQVFRYICHSICCVRDFSQVCRARAFTRTRTRTPTRMQIALCAEEMSIQELFTRWLVEYYNWSNRVESRTPYAASTIHANIRILCFGMHAQRHCPFGILSLFICAQSEKPI